MFPNVLFVDTSICFIALGTYVLPASRIKNDGPLPLLGNYEQIVLLQLILESPGLYLHEIQELLQEKLGCGFTCQRFARHFIVWDALGKEFNI